MTDPVAILRRTAALVVILTLCGAPVATAQTPPAGASAQTTILSSAAFAHLIEGKQLIVTTNDGLQYVGVFQVSGNELVATGPKLALTLPLDQIRRVQKDSFRIRTHTLIGLAVGTAVGTALFFGACGRDCSGDGQFWFIYTVFSAGIGAGIGAGVGAGLNSANRERDILYDTRRRTTTVAVGPILTPSRKGVAFTMTWR